MGELERPSSNPCGDPRKVVVTSGGSVKTAYRSAQVERLGMKPVKVGEPSKVGIPSQARKGRCRDSTAGT